MENSDDVCDRDESASGSSSPARNSQYRLFGRQSMIYQCMGGGLDVLLLVVTILFLKANFAVYRNSYFLFFTLAYIGVILSMTVPALYSKHEAPVDKCFGLLHRKFSPHYKIANENFISKLSRSLSKNKNM